MLVVEDDPGMTRVLQRGLTEEGYVVDACTDGAEAGWRVRELPYDAMVLDVMLPGERRLRGLPAAARGPTWPCRSSC